MFTLLCGQVFAALHPANRLILTLTFFQVWNEYACNVTDVKPIPPEGEERLRRALK